jgi:nucleotide-binding universal stress UspA family protein
MYETIVVGTDGSATAALAEQAAVELTRRFGAKLHVVRAYQLPSSVALASSVAEAAGGLAEADRLVSGEVSAALEALAEELQGAGIDVATHARPGGAAQAIIDVAEAHGADLVVVGNRGMHGARRLLGSVPNTVTHHARCSVLVVNSCDG